MIFVLCLCHAVFFKLRNLHPILTLVPCIEIIIFRRKQFFLSAKCMSLFAIGFPNVMSFRNSIVFVSLNLII